MDIEREVIEGIGPNGQDVREYTHDGDKFASVTTILETLEEDKSHLEAWKDRNDGQGNNALHHHLFWYSRHIGTLGHWAALNEVAHVPWTDDEQQSIRELESMGAHEVSGYPAREVLYSVLRGDKNKAGGTVRTWGEFYDKYPPYKSNAFYAQQLYQRALTDIQFFKDAQLSMWNELGITEDSVIEAEKYLFEPTYQYAGQVDLVYEDPEGHIVVADLKSSSGCYDKHQIQGAAYAKAVEMDDNIPFDTVDRLEVHRAHPRSGEMAVHTHSDAVGQQPIHTTKWWDTSYDECWNEFEELASEFEYDNGH